VAGPSLTQWEVGKSDMYPIVELLQDAWEAGCHPETLPRSKSLCLPGHPAGVRVVSAVRRKGRERQSWPDLPQASCALLSWLECEQDKERGDKGPSLPRYTEPGRLPQKDTSQLQICLLGPGWSQERLTSAQKSLGSNPQAISHGMVSSPGDEPGGQGHGPHAAS
jgi:hypothetical protein